MSKYADHLPLYQQAQIYARKGLHLDGSTLTDWVGHAAFHLRPLHERLLAALRDRSKLFADETAAAGPAPIASEALKHIAAFYAIEKVIRGRSPEERCLVRQQKSRPLADAFKAGLRAKQPLISQKSNSPPPLATASRAGRRFIDDGRIELDNITVERSIRGIKLSRKNALFAGSDNGAEHWAVVASLIETYKLNDVDPLSYLTDVLTRIVNGHPNRDQLALKTSKPSPRQRRLRLFRTKRGDAVKATVAAVLQIFPARPRQSGHRVEFNVSRP